MAWISTHLLGFRLYCYIHIRSQIEFQIEIQMGDIHHRVPIISKSIYFYLNIYFDFNFLVVSGSCVLDALPHVWVAYWGGEHTVSESGRSAGTVVRLRELGRGVLMIIKMISSMG